MSYKYILAADPGQGKDLSCIIISRWDRHSQRFIIVDSMRMDLTNLTEKEKADEWEKEIKRAASFYKDVKILTPDGKFESNRD
jgi:hypothetical protein